MKGGGWGERDVWLFGSTLSEGRISRWKLSSLENHLIVPGPTVSAARWCMGTLRGQSDRGNSGLTLSLVGA